MFRRSVLLWLLTLPLAAQPPRQFPLEAFLGPSAAPSRPTAVWAPEGKRFAYLQGGSIWLYDVPTASRKELIALSKLEARAAPPPPAEGFDWQNRRVQEQSFQWSANGREMLIAAGGDLFYFHMDGGAADQLTATAERERDPKLSPDSRWVSFRREHDLYCLEIATRRTRRLTRDGSATLLNAELDWVYPEELSLSTAHWWAPDSSRIAFLQFDVSRESVFPQVHLLQPKVGFEPQLFPQPGTPNADVRLATVTPAGELRWMDIGEPRDKLLARVHWSPDSRALAVERLNKVQNQIDLVLADARSGSSRVVLHEEDSAWINVRDDFHFLGRGERFLWGSERDGFRHLYLYSIEGKRLSQVTKGDWEVTQIAGVDEDARLVFYLSTEASPLERHLYRAGFDGRHRQRLTSATGTHSISMSPVCDYYLDTFSTANQPPASAIYDRGGERVATYAEAARPPEWLLRTELVDFKAADGEKLYARLIRPPDFTAGKKYPVVVSIYGGPGVQRVTDAWSQQNLDQYLAHRGFVIWQVDNRGSAGRGHKWEARVHRNLGEQELTDQLDGLRHLDSLGFVDSSRVGLNGWSYGGYMTLYALTHAPAAFRAGAAGAPVTDWRNYDSIYTERYMGTPEDNEEGYRRSAPVTSAAALQGRLLLMHNVQDDNVHFANTMQMAAALEEAGRQFDLSLYPQRSHGVTGPLRAHLWRRISEFLESSLK